MVFSSGYEKCVCEIGYNGTDIEIIGETNCKLPSKKAAIFIASDLGVYHVIWSIIPRWHIKRSFKKNMVI